MRSFESGREARQPKGVLIDISPRTFLSSSLSSPFAIAPRNTPSKKAAWAESFAKLKPVVKDTVPKAIRHTTYPYSPRHENQVSVIKGSCSGSNNPS